MNLFKETFHSLIWLLRVLKAFLKARPLLTILVIVFETLSRLIHIVAFLLPLKVILLVGSEGVPRYFAFFVEPEQKMAWVAGLALASVCCYLLTLILDALNHRLGALGASKVVDATQKMTVLSKQKEKSERYYARITSIFALFLFMFAALLILYFTNIRVLLYFVALNLGFFIFTAIILATGQKKQIHSSIYVPGNALTRWIIKNQKDYISILSSIIFLICFLIILYPYFHGTGPNILLSLIAFVVIRQTSTRSEQLVNKILAAHKNRFDVNRLVFKGNQQASKQFSAHWQSFFSTETRHQAIAEALALNEAEKNSLNSHWIDTGISGIKLFQGSFQHNNQLRFFQQQAYSTNEKHRYERENFLFEHISRASLKAPHKLADFQMENYTCQLLDAGTGETLSDDEWMENAEHHRRYYWSVPPPASLIKIYKASQPLLHQLLKETLLDQLFIATQTQQDIALLKDIKRKISVIQEKISKVPLYIHNSQLHRKNLLWADNEHTDILLMTWQRWSLKPIGADWSLEELDDQENVKNRLEWLHSTRKDVSKKNIQFEDIVLACCCAHLNSLIEKQEYSAALSVLKRIRTII